MRVNHKYIIGAKEYGAEDIEVGNAHIYVSVNDPEYQPSPIAQSVERSAVNRKVGGSSPPGRAFFHKFFFPIKNAPLSVTQSAQQTFN